MAEEHVRGRMPLESNPGNRNPAIPPVFDTTGEEDYRRVTPDNPLPTKDKDLDERLSAIENKLDSVIENGAINTQLTGSNVEHAEAIPVKQLTRNVKVLSVDASFNTTIPAKTDKSWDIYAPEGWLAKEIVDVRMKVDMPEGFSEGHHFLAFSRKVLTSKHPRGDYAISSGRHTDTIQFTANGGFDPSEEGTAFPTNSDEILTTYKLLSFDDETPIQAYYNNATDADQTYKIDIQLKCIMEKKVD